LGIKPHFELWKYFATELQRKKQRRRDRLTWWCR
jgi:hypothetical protein